MTKSEEFEKLAAAVVPRVELKVEPMDLDSELQEWRARSDKHDATGIGRTPEEAEASVRQYLAAYFLTHPSKLKEEYEAQKSALKAHVA